MVRFPLSSGILALQLGSRFQKTLSRVGLGNVTSLQSFELVSVNLVLCVPSANPTAESHPQLMNKIILIERVHSLYARHYVNV